MHVGWTSARPLELRGAWISNACTDLQRVYRSSTCVGRLRRACGPVRHACGPSRGSLQPGRPVLLARRRRWSCVRTLDKRTCVGVARPVDLQRTHRSPTYVPISNACGPVRQRQWAGARDSPMQQHLPGKLPRPQAQERTGEIPRSIPARPRGFAANRSAMDRIATEAGASGSSITSGRPWSPPSRRRTSNGI